MIVSQLNVQPAEAAWRKLDPVDGDCVFNGDHIVPTHVYDADLHLSYMLIEQRGMNVLSEWLQYLESVDNQVLSSFHVPREEQFNPHHGMPYVV